MKLHIRMVHQGDAGKIFKCEQCDFSTANKQNLKNHIQRIHLGIKKSEKVKCPYCPKHYQSYSSLHAHKQKHHPLKLAQERAAKIQKRLAMQKLPVRLSGTGRDEAGGSPRRIAHSGQGVGDTPLKSETKTETPNNEKTTSSPGKAKLQIRKSTVGRMTAKKKTSNKSPGRTGKTAKPSSGKMSLEKKDAGGKKMRNGRVGPQSMTGKISKCEISEAKPTDHLAEQSENGIKENEDTCMKEAQGCLSPGNFFDTLGLKHTEPNMPCNTGGKNGVFKGLPNGSLRIKLNTKKAKKPRETKMVACRSKTPKSVTGKRKAVVGKKEAAGGSSSKSVTSRKRQRQQFLPAATAADDELEVPEGNLAGPEIYIDMDEDAQETVDPEGVDTSNTDNSLMTIEISNQPSHIGQAIGEIHIAPPQDLTAVKQEYVLPTPPSCQTGLTVAKEYDSLRALIADFVPGSERHTETSSQEDAMTVTDHGDTDIILSGQRLKEEPELGMDCIMMDPEGSVESPPEIRRARISDTLRRSQDGHSSLHSIL